VCFCNTVVYYKFFFAVLTLSALFILGGIGVFLFTITSNQLWGDPASCPMDTKDPSSEIKYPECETSRSPLLSAGIVLQQRLIFVLGPRRVTDPEFLNAVWVPVTDAWHVLWVMDGRHGLQMRRVAANILNK
jgi:hypothetical protein